MLIPKDKDKLLEEFKTKYVEGYFDTINTKLVEKINNNKEDLKRKILIVFKEIFTKATAMQKENLKGEIQYIYISYLRTSLLENKCIYRIDLYDDKWFLDKEECAADIDLTIIYEPLFNHMNELNNRKKEYGRVINEMDIEKIKLKEADKYNKICMELFKDIINDIVESFEYKEMNKKRELGIFIGEYLHEATPIFRSLDEM